MAHLIINVWLLSINHSGLIITENGNEKRDDSVS